MPKHLESYYQIDKVVNNCPLTDFAEGSINSARDPMNFQIFNFLYQPTEIHWIARSKAVAEVHFKFPQNFLPSNFETDDKEQRRKQFRYKMYSLKFLRATVIDPIIWDYPIENGRGFANDLMDDIRTRWNMQLESGKRLFKNTDPIDATREIEWGGSHA